MTLQEKLDKQLSGSSIVKSKKFTVQGVLIWYFHNSWKLKPLNTPSCKTLFTPLFIKVSSKWQKLLNRQLHVIQIWFLLLLILWISEKKVLNLTSCYLLVKPLDFQNWNQVKKEFFRIFGFWRKTLIVTQKKDVSELLPIHKAAFQVN